MTGHTPIHIDRTGKLDLDIKNESCIKIKISTWQEMIKVMNHNLNTTTQQTQNNNHEDYHKRRSENDIFKTTTQRWPKSSPTLQQKF